MKAMLPYLAKIQDDDDKLVQLNLRLVQATSFLIFPATMFLAGAATPIISIMISDKWLPSAPLLQILCLSVLFDHVSTINWEFLLAKGRSDILLRQQWYTKGISLLMLVISIFIGLKAVAIGKGLSSFILVISSLVSLRKVLPISLKDVYISLYRMLYSALILGIGVFISFMFLDYSIFNVAIVFILTMGLYLLMARLLFPQTLSSLVCIIKKKNCKI